MSGDARDVMKVARIKWGAFRAAACEAFVRENNLCPSECQIICKGDDEWIVDKAQKLEAKPLPKKPTWEQYRELRL